MRTNFLLPCKTLVSICDLLCTRYRSITQDCRESLQRLILASIALIATFNLSWAVCCCNMKGNLAEIIILILCHYYQVMKTVEVMWSLVHFLSISFLKSWPFFSMFSGAVNHNNLNFLWFNVEQVFILSMGHVISGCFSMTLRRWCFKCS